MAIVILVVVAIYPRSGWNNFAVYGVLREGLASKFNFSIHCRWGVVAGAASG